VAAFGVVPGLDVGKECRLCLSLCLEGSTRQQFSFQGAEEALGHGVVIGIPDTAHGRSHAHLLAAFTKGNCCVLAAPVAVMDDIIRSPGLESHVECHQHELGADVIRDDQHQHQVELRGKTLLDWQLESIRAAGITEIAIVTGYKRELLANRGLVEFHNLRWADTNMVSSLACAETWLKAEPCIVSYSDIFYSPAAVEALMNCQASLAVTYDPNWLELWTQRFGDPLLDAETFRLTSEHALAEIGNKPKSVDEVQGQYMGLLRFTPEGWDEVVRIRSELTAEQCDRMHMTGTLQKVIDAGRIRIDAISYDGEWGEIDSAEDLATYHATK